MDIYDQVMSRSRRIAEAMLEGLEAPKVKNWREPREHYDEIQSKGVRAVIQAAEEIIKDEDDARAFLNGLLVRRRSSEEPWDITGWFTGVSQLTGAQFGGNPWSSLARVTLKELPQYEEALECVRQAPSPPGMGGVGG